MNSADTEQYRESVRQLEEALELGASYLSDSVLDQGTQILTAAKQRLELGVEHTIVALAGGTGSGKSSTFNQISGLEFADVGAKRPTTVRTAACTWDSDASALLDWIDVDPDRRISRDTALDGADQAALRGLILLDLPDHDSVAEHHRAIVNRVLPLVDMLIWIVDPQKYADHSLHVDFLREMVDARASMIVALNQIDTVPLRQREELIWDVAKLLAEDGLAEVEVRPISAKTGEGIRELRDEIRVAVAGKSMAARRLSDELHKLARLIEDEVPSGVAVDLSESARAEADRYLVAAGVPALADEVSLLTAEDRALGSPPSIQPPSEATLSGLRNRWLDRVTEGLGERWAQAIKERPVSSDQLAADLREAFSTVSVPWGHVPGVSKRIVGGLIAVAALLAAAGIVALAGVFGSTTLGLALLGGGLLLAVVAWIVASRRRATLRRVGRDRADTLREESAQAVVRVLQSDLFRPAEDVLTTHEKIAARARRVHSGTRSA